MINYKKYINELLPINNQEIFLNIFDNIFSKNKVDLEDYHLEINADNINSIVNLFLNILDKYLVIKDSEITQNLIDLYQQIVRKTSYSRYIYSKVFEKDINEMDRFDLFVFISNCILDDKNYLCKDKKLNLTKHKSYVEIINNYDFFEKLLIEFPFFFKSLALFLYSLNTINMNLNIDLINKIIINEASCSSDYKVNIEVDVALFFKNSTEIINNFFNVNNEFVYKSINSKENLPVILNKLCYSYKFKSDDNLFFLNELISKALKENIIDIDFFKLNSSVKLNENNLKYIFNEKKSLNNDDLIRYFKNNLYIDEDILNYMFKEKVININNLNLFLKNFDYTMLKLDEKENKEKFNVFITSIKNFFGKDILLESNGNSIFLEDVLLNKMTNETIDIIYNYENLIDIDFNDKEVLKKYNLKRNPFTTFIINSINSNNKILKNNQSLFELNIKDLHSLFTKKKTNLECFLDNLVNINNDYTKIVLSNLLSDFYINNLLNVKSKEYFFKSNFDILLNNKNSYQYSYPLNIEAYILNLICDSKAERFSRDFIKLINNKDILKSNISALERVIFILSTSSNYKSEYINEYKEKVKESENYKIISETYHETYSKFYTEQLNLLSNYLNDLGKILKIFSLMNIETFFSFNSANEWLLDNLNNLIDDIKNCNIKKNNDFLIVDKLRGRDIINVNLPELNERYILSFNKEKSFSKENVFIFKTQVIFSLLLNSNGECSDNNFNYFKCLLNKSKGDLGVSSLLKIDKIYKDIKNRKYLNDFKQVDFNRIDEIYNYVNELSNIQKLKNKKIKI